LLTHLASQPLATFLGAFLLAFPTLFSIVNPFGSALIFKEATAERTPTERHYLARRIAVYAACLLIGSMLIGGVVLGFFGISIGALRVAGGLVVSVSAWGLLMEPQRHEDRKTAEAAPNHGDPDDVAFFPLTMPLTTGPGTIAIAIALASQRPAQGVDAAAFYAGGSLAAVAIAVLVWLSYGWSDQVVVLLGHRGARIVSRLTAFILLCVGVQIIATGAQSLAGMVLAAPPHR
jgi:multiple antibiotic resistance protein